MGKSHKKTPILKDPGDKKWIKRQASKAVRRYKCTIADGGSYRKIFCSWEIYDYLFYEPWNVETKKEYEEHGGKLKWSKSFFRK